MVYASDSGWTLDDAHSPVNLSGSGDIRQPAMAINTAGEVAVVWSNLGNNAANGIFIATGAGHPLTPSVALVSSGEQNAWAPDVAYWNDTLVAAWVQGTFPYPGTIMQQDGVTGTPRTVMGPVYGYTTPRLLIGQEHLHLFFASAPNENDWSKTDLYHAQRNFTATEWLSPTLIITRAQANQPIDTVGSIWYPHAALNAAGDTAHVTWEQTADPLVLARYSVWYAQGTWQADQQTFDWSAPLTRLSSADKRGVRPKIAVDNANRVHVAWVEQQIVEISDKFITLQYIAYRRLENGQWMPPLDQPAQRLDPEPVQVNAFRPTWSNIAIDARGDDICIAWHGYRGAPGVSGLEEILLKCSQNGGRTWAAQTTNASETPLLSLFPAMRLDMHRNVRLVWEQHQGGLEYRTNYDAVYRQGAFPRTRIYLPLVMRF